MHETKDGKKGTGLSRNNPCGIKHRGVGAGFRTFKTLDEGRAACYDLYIRKYSKMSIYDMSRTWTATDQDPWHKNVSACYFKNRNK